MSLVRISLPADLPPVAAEAADLIADAQRRIDAFVEARANRPVHAFVPSDFAMVYRALSHVAHAGLASGPLFCEWGSGAGVVTCLAAMLGFEACGIEFERDLVDLATDLARDRGLAVNFHVGNLVPSSGQRIAEQVDEFEWLATGGADPYEEMGLDVDDFDVIFAYPWPGEQRVIERLFDRFAAGGALLLTYNGAEGVNLFRKKGRSARD